MKNVKWVSLVCVLALSSSVFAVSTPHIGGAAGGTIYVKGPYSGGPNNSPLHESWNLTDEFIGGDPNPNYLGLYKTFIFYDGTLHIDPTGKVGFTNKIYASGNDSSMTVYPDIQRGTVIVEGELFGPELRPWKNGCPMTLNVMGDGILTLDLLRLGYNEGSPISEGVFNMSGGVTTLGNLTFLGDGSYLDVTGGELLVLSSSLDEDAINGLIATNDIINSTGEGLLVTTKNVGGADYTSVTLVPEPMTLMVLGLGGVAMLRRRRS